MSVNPQSLPTGAGLPSRAGGLTIAWRLAALRTGGFPVMAVAILLGLLIVAIFADALAPSNPEVGRLGERFRPPAWQTDGSARNLLGTDHIGRDVLSRLIYGTRVSMIVGLTAVIVAGLVGTVLGILSGYLGGWVDQLIMRVTDTWLALPALTFAIFLAAMTLGRWFGPGLIDHHGRARTVRIFGALALVGLALVVWGSTLPVAMAGAALWGLGTALGFPVGMSAAGDEPAHAPARVSVVATIGYIAFLAGPPLIGFLGQHTGTLRALTVTGALIALGLLISGVLRPQPAR